MVSVPHGVGYAYEEGGIVSGDGHCRSFDGRARGSVMGNGVGVVVLRRLEDAMAGGDTIYAVIRGSAVNNDGLRKVGFTAPGLGGQRDVILGALADADVAADTSAMSRRTARARCLATRSSSRRWCRRSGRARSARASAFWGR